MNFLFKALIKRQLKHLPEAEVDKLLTIIEKNPELFQKIAMEIKAKTDAGMKQEDVAIEVMKAHETELRQVLGK